MEHSFFSVIVPVCRCGKYAECLVKSLLRQSFGDFEALILDDGSGDGTLDAYRRQAGGEKRFRFFELEHGGTASRLRNAGIRLAQGRYLIFPMSWQSGCARRWNSLTVPCATERLRQISLF